MRLATMGDGSGRACVVRGNLLTPLRTTTADILRTPPSGWRDLPEDGPPQRLDEMPLAAPTPRPGKIIAIGMNYRDHCAEQGVDPPREPLVFAKFPTSVIGPEAPVSWPSGVENVDWEVELAVVVGVDVVGDIGIAGYTVANDISAREIQTRDGQFVRAKSIDTFCPLGPWIVSSDELPDPSDLAISLSVNGVQMQSSRTNQMLFGASELVEFCRHFFSLEPGDVILTGTPPGVGAFRQPPIFLAPGDVMVAQIDGIGELRTPVAGPRWP